MQNPSDPDPQRGPQRAAIEYKYSEDEILDLLRAYIDKTYSEHYVTKSVQTIDVWDALNIGAEACQSNVLKYAMRLGKKDGHNPKDMMKILHYTILWYHFTFLKPEQNKIAEMITALESQLATTRDR